MKNQSTQQASDGRPDRGAPGEIRRKDFAVEVKAVDEAAGTIELYCAVFNNVDRQGDMIAPGAFTNLPDFVASGWVAINHQNQCLPVAYVESAVQDGHGLRIVGRFHTTPEAQAARTVVAERKAAGKAVKCSFGFRVLDSSTERRDGESINVLKSLEIYEASIVNLPANPAAEVTAVKSADELVGLKTIGQYIEGIKAGKVLSAENHGKLKEFAKGLLAHGKSATAMAEGLKAFLAGHGPMDDEDEPDDDEDGGKPSDDDGDEPKKKPKTSKSDDLSVDRERLRLAALVKLPSL